MSPRRQLAELRADRDIYLTYLSNVDARVPVRATVGGAFRDGMRGSMNRLLDVVADIERQIARLEAGGEA